MYIHIRKIHSKPSGKVLTVNLVFKLLNLEFLALSLVFLENCVCVIIAVKLTGRAQM